MAQFSWMSPVKILFGPGALEALANEARAFGERIAVVTGKSGTARIAAEKVIPRLCGHAELINSVNPEPNVDDVLSLKSDLQRMKPDAVIALGGGSVIDAAKLAASLVANPKPLEDYLLKGERLECPGIPVIAVPTTAGTGSEVDFTSMIRIPSHQLKRPVSQPLNGCKAAVLDPELTLSLSPIQTAISGADAITHALECYVSKDYSPPSKSLALSALAGLLGHYERAVTEGRDLGARTEMMLGSVMAGVAMLNAGLGVVHAVAHALAGYFLVSHGHVCACLLPHSIRLNAETAPEGYARAARLVAGGAAPANDRDAANWLADHLDSLFSRCGIEPKVRAPVRQADVPWDGILGALKYSKSLVANPRPVTAFQCQELLSSILEYEEDASDTRRMVG